jgi:mevalonate kinase
LLSGEFFSRGKFLLSGEYLVLYGAKALAVPLRYGQRMVVKSDPEENLLSWDTKVCDQSWFSAKFTLPDLNILNCSDHHTAAFIQKLLKSATELQNDNERQCTGLKVENFIDFDINWGLGSSSSLVSNVAWWFNVDLYSLYRKIYKGSGYDVFCARSEHPIIYSLIDEMPDFHEVDFDPPFRDHLYFIYLGRKQDSQKSVTHFRINYSHNDRMISEISGLTGRLIDAKSLDDFMNAVRCHEELMSEVLQMRRVGQKLFPDFTGEIKSMGAWGGDFVLAASPLDYNEVKEYFSSKNLPVVLQWEEIVYNQ